MTTLHLLHQLEALLATGSKLWALGSELFTATALLWAINFAANAIRTTYRAGALAGRICWPAIHWLARVGRLIDWREVAATVSACLVVLVAAAITAGQLALPTLCRVSEAMGGAYSRFLGLQAPAQAMAATAAVTTTTAAPAAIQAPAAPATELQGLRVKELRQLARAAGHKALARSGRKADLLAALTA